MGSVLSSCRLLVKCARFVIYVPTSRVLNRYSEIAPDLSTKIVDIIKIEKFSPCYTGLGIVCPLLNWIIRPIMLTND